MGLEGSQQFLTDPLWEKGTSTWLLMTKEYEYHMIGFWDYLFSKKSRLAGFMKYNMAIHDVYQHSTLWYDSTWIFMSEIDQMSLEKKCFSRFRQYDGLKKL